MTFPCTSTEYATSQGISLRTAQKRLAEKVANGTILRRPDNIYEMAQTIVGFDEKWLKRTGQEDQFRARVVSRDDRVTLVALQDGRYISYPSKQLRIISNV